MDNALKPIMIAVGVFMTCIVISIAVNLSSTSTRIGSSFGTRIAKVNKAISEGDILVYDDDGLSGSDVISCINRYKDELTINVTKIVSTDGNTYTTQYSKVSGRFDNVPSNIRSYINPNAVFVGTVNRNVNGVISDISFTQEYYVADAGQSGTGSVPGAELPSDSGESTITASTITALINSLETTRSQVESQIRVQTQTINELLDKFTELQSAFKDLQDYNSSGNAGSDTGNNSGSSDENSSILEALRQSVASMANQLEDLVNRFSVIEQFVYDVNDRLDDIEMGNSNSNVNDVDSTDYTQLRQDIEALQYNVSSISDQIDSLNAVEITSENVEELRSLTVNLQNETSNAKNVADTLIAQLDGNTSTTADDIRTSITGIKSLLDTMDSELIRIAETLQY